MLLVMVWAFGLTCGMALPIQPKLATSIGARGSTPQISAFRVLFLFNSFVGMSVLSLTLMYLMQL